MRRMLFLTFLMCSLLTAQEDLYHSSKNYRNLKREADRSLKQYFKEGEDLLAPCYFDYLLSFYRFHYYSEYRSHLQNFMNRQAKSYRSGIRYHAESKHEAEKERDSIYHVMADIGAFWDLHAHQSYCTIGAPKDLAYCKRRIDYSTECMDRISANYHKIRALLNGGMSLCSSLFLDLNSRYLENDFHSRAHFERGMIYFDQGNTCEALEDIAVLVQSGDASHMLPESNISESDLHLYQGEAFAEAGLYEQAVVALDEALKQDPENWEAYYQKAIAYFEMGDFDLSIENYLDTGYSAPSLQHYEVSTLELAKGLIQGVTHGCGETLVDFIPSMLSSIRGLGHGLWAFAVDPIDVTCSMAQATRNFVDFVSAESLASLAQIMVPELEELIQQKENISEFRKGELVGSIIGRYGTDFLLIAGIGKGVKIAKDLKRANTTLSLKTLSKSVEAKEIITEVSTKWWGETSKRIELIKQNGQRLDSGLYKAFRSQQLSENQVRKILHTAGYKTFPRPKGIPADWKVAISKDNGGMKYIHPDTTHVYIRVSPGDSIGSNIAQKEPYVVLHTSKGRLNKLGRLVAEDSFDSHIPLKECDVRMLVERYNEI